jgi:hypothetical protein
MTEVLSIEEVAGVFLDGSEDAGVVDGAGAGDEVVPGSGDAHGARYGEGWKVEDYGFQEFVGAEDDGGGGHGCGSGELKLY